MRLPLKVRGTVLRGEKDYGIIDADGHLIAEFFDQVGDHSFDDAKANAEEYVRLITQERARNADRAAEPQTGEDDSRRATGKDGPVA